METKFIGEHLLPGQLGHFFVILSFIAALASSIAYFLSVKNEGGALEFSWKKIGRTSFFIHGISVLGIVGTLFYVLYNHYFEYHYVWQHSSRELPSYYLFSCFWEGQEGSFLLWSVWHVIIGTILIFKINKWEASVISVVAFVQVFLASMLLGIFVFGYKLGSSPFILLRKVMVNAPIFQQPDYLSKIADGNGLNPLLQNYWMVIHPPVLFLGFAACLVPFAFVIGALWRRKYTEWVYPAFPWVLFAVMILGTGILMGAAWAYEALNFGGYWAWDPVENASIIPWLILVAGLHTLLAYRHTGHALKATIFLLSFTFILILYASFLTRSGVLGDTSVHAFTTEGMYGHLISFIVAFLIILFTFLILRWKEIPVKKTEEETYSREFWLFIGSLVFFISAMQIIFTTSIPVINKIFGSNLAPPANVVEHYNKWQMPIAVIICIISACGQYFRYKSTPINVFLRSLLPSIIIAVVISVAMFFITEIKTWHYMLFLFAAIFTVTANLLYIITILKGNLRFSGGAVSHIGFGLMLAGVLISSVKKEVISFNNLGIDYGEGFDEKNKMENMLLYQDIPSKMAGYELTYKGDTVEGPNIYYKVRYRKLDEKGNAEEEFTLMPNAQINEKMGGLIASPDTRHYLFKDIYTHVSSIPDKREEEKEAAANRYKEYTIGIGDTTILPSGINIIYEGIDLTASHPDYKAADGDIAMGARLKVKSFDTSYTAIPLLVLRGNEFTGYDQSVKPLDLKLSVRNIIPKSEKIVLGVFDEKPPAKWIIMKAIVFPFMNFIWLGALIMITGIIMSIVKRAKENKRLKESAAA